jgi:UDP-glucuronate decarboxylase
MSNARIALLNEDAEHALRDVPLEGLEGKTIVITGASGLIGCHFVAGMLWGKRNRRLKVEIHAVVHHGMPAWLQDLTAGGEVHFHQGNLEKHEFSRTIPDADFIVHAATYGQPGLFTAHPLSTLQLNTTATFALLERLRPGGKFLFLSTSEIYSGLSNPPFHEDQIGTTNTNHPRASYIEAKRCGEAICHSARQMGVQAKSARLALAYGPGIRAGDKRVLNVFIEKALRLGEIRLLDEGKAKRTYCYIADAMHMLWNIWLHGDNAIYNVGGSSQTTVGALAQSIGQLLGVPVIFPHSNVAGARGAPDDVRLDITKFEREFSPMSFEPLEVGLSRTIEWIRCLY